MSPTMTASVTALLRGFAGMLCDDDHLDVVVQCQQETSETDQSSTSNFHIHKRHGFTSHNKQGEAQFTKVKLSNKQEVTRKKNNISVALSLVAHVPCKARDMSANLRGRSWSQ